MRLPLGRQCARVMPERFRASRRSGTPGRWPSVTAVIEVGCSRRLSALEMRSHSRQRIGRLVLAGEFLVPVVEDQRHLEELPPMSW